jgi:SNF2-related domain
MNYYFLLKTKGKSLQVVALVHTLLHHPSLRPPNAVNSRPFIRNILLIVPVNTIANWTNEFDKWTGKLKHSVRYFDYSSVQIASRPKILQDWSDLGGVFLIGSDAFTRLAKMDSMNKVCHSELVFCKKVSLQRPLNVL